MMGNPSQIATGVPDGIGKPGTEAVSVGGMRVAVGLVVGVNVGSGVSVGISVGVVVGSGVEVRVGRLVAVGTGVSVGFAERALHAVSTTTRTVRMIALQIVFMFLPRLF